MVLVSDVYIYLLTTCRWVICLCSRVLTSDLSSIYVLLSDPSIYSRRASIYISMCWRVIYPIPVLPSVLSIYSRTMSWVIYLRSKMLASDLSSTYVLLTCWVIYLYTHARRADEWSLNADEQSMCLPFVALLLHSLSGQVHLPAVGAGPDEQARGRLGPHPQTHLGVVGTTVVVRRSVVAELVAVAERVWGWEWHGQEEPYVPYISY